MIPTSALHKPTDISARLICTIVSVRLSIDGVEIHCRQIVALSLAQFVIELRKLPKARESFPRRYGDHLCLDVFNSLNLTDCRSERGFASQPLLSDDDHVNEQLYPPKSIKTRPRSKSKPDDIFIHPAESNIARADAVALEMGLGGETDRVRGSSYLRDEPAWETGKGRDMAREMLLGSHRKKSSPEQSSVNVGSDDDYS